MKKTAKRLALKAETIRALSDEKLSHVHGGATALCPTAANCPTHYCTNTNGVTMCVVNGCSGSGCTGSYTINASCPFGCATNDCGNG